MTTLSTSTPRGAFGHFAEILGMIKFSHTIFALPFALLAATMASHTTNGWTFRPLDWVGIVLCMVAARSAAMAFNRLADAAIDARNPRTAQRHLPAGRLSRASVVLFTIGSCLLFVAATALFLPRNPWPIVFSIPVLAWLLAYSYAKRFTSAAHFWLGAALALAPVCAWVAIRASVSAPPLLLGLAVLFWVAGFDILYACQDFEFDRSEGLRSVPALLGIAGALRLAAVCHLLMLLALAAMAWVYPMGLVFAIWLGCVAALLIYEHSLVRPSDLTRVNVAFFRVNAVISMGSLVVGVVDLLV